MDSSVSLEIGQSNVGHIGNLIAPHIVPYHNAVVVAQPNAALHNLLLLEILAQARAAPVAIFVAEFDADSVVSHHLAARQIVNHQRQVAVGIVVVVANVHGNVVNLDTTHAVRL